jgi:glyoxylase-like metal-dependent hydrolase (beta-lactamase superfamily II)
LSNKKRIKEIKAWIHIFITGQKNNRKNLAKSGVFWSNSNRLRTHVMAVLGHTRGSAVFIDDANKMIFTEDDINISLWMHLHECTGMKTWRTGAKKIIEYFEKGYSGWDGHSEGQVKATYHLSEGLIQEAKEGTLDKKENCISNKDTFPQIRYKVGRV